MSNHRLRSRKKNVHLPSQGFMNLRDKRLERNSRKKRSFCLNTPLEKQVSCVKRWWLHYLIRSQMQFCTPISFSEVCTCGSRQTLTPHHVSLTLKDFKNKNKNKKRSCLQSPAALFSATTGLHTATSRETHSCIHPTKK